MATATMKPSWNLEELVQVHQAGVWRYLRFLGCDESQADDLTQETFLSVHRSPFEPRAPEATSAYLRTVARHLFLMALRRRNRQPAVEDLELADEVFVAFHRDDSGEAYLDALRECLEGIQGRARESIDLHYRDGRSRAEIASRLEMTEDGVKSLLRRTREALRRCVEQRLAQE
jgi:RNA polymerase sigma-70 factor (ECF subfamily)